MKKNVVSFLFFVTLFSLYGCGGNSKVKKATQVLFNYLHKEGSAPTVETYQTIGFKEIDHVDRINAYLASKAEDIDTVTKIKSELKRLLEDKEPPEIKLIGEENISLELYGNYEDPGASARDNIEGNITRYISIDSDVDTNKAGEYRVIYVIRDNAGNESHISRRVHVKEKDSEVEVSVGLSESNSSIDVQSHGENNTTRQSVLENAEDAKRVRWQILYDRSGQASIINRYDETKQSRVIVLKGSVTNKNIVQTAFRYQGTLKQDYPVIKWRMKTAKNFNIRFILNTKNGEREIEYFPKDTGKGRTSYNKREKIGHGIGSDATDNTWHTFIRDLDRDIQRYEPDNQFRSIKYIDFMGDMALDDLKLYDSAKNVAIDRSAVIEAPGIVLTFDDSRVKSWNEAMEMFEEYDVVATFFCHRWGSEGNDISQEELATLKEFESKGHEIAYHTVDHVSTRDERYEKYSTIEQKAQAYFRSQIEPGVENMRKRGFNPESFSYPYITGQPAHNKVIRETLPHIREFFSYVYSIDEPPAGGSKTLKEIKELLDKLKKEKEIGVLLGHLIVKEKDLDTDTHIYKTSMGKLKAIIRYAEEIGLTFYTLKEAHRIYTNQ